MHWKVYYYVVRVPPAICCNGLWHMLSIVIEPIRLPRSLGLFTPTYAVAISVRLQKDGFTIIFNVIVGVIVLYRENAIAIESEASDSLT